MDNVIIHVLPRLTADRSINTYYTRNGKTVFWTGKYVKCEHLKLAEKCVDCSGSQICEHKKQRATCALCKGSQICEHGISKGHCRSCSGRVFCEHDCRKTVCKQCKGSQICEHNKIRSYCVPCKGGCICEHGKVKRVCKLCKGSGICKHNLYKFTCKECGNSHCEHKVEKKKCRICKPNGYLIDRIRSRVQSALKNYTEKKKKHTIEYLGCSIETLREHLEKQFVTGMEWNSLGEWHIDHIRPCASFDLEDEEEKHKCFHYTNLQPMWATENISKGASYDEATFPMKWVVDHWVPK